jgi:hypothetical protein
MYRAAVKYPVNATDAERISALKQGIEDCALELFEELGVCLEDVQDVLEEASRTVEYADQWRQDNP